MRYLYLALLATFLVSSQLSAQLLKGRAAAERLPETAMLRFADDNIYPQYILLNKENQHHLFSNGDQWLLRNLELPEGSSFEVLTDDVDRHGNRHVRLQLYFNGNEVRASQMILHGRGDYWDHATGDLYVPAEDATATALITESQAIATALDVLPAEVYGWESQPALASYPEPTLTWVPEELKFNQNSLQLTYAVKVYTVRPLGHKTLYLDVATGSVIAKEEHIHTHEEKHCDHDHHGHQHAVTPESVVPGTAETAYAGTRSIETQLDGSVYILHDDTRGMGLRTYNCETQDDYPFIEFEDDDNFWDNVNPQQDEVATDAHWGSAAFYDYLLGLGRNSIDNNGEIIESHVHYGDGFVNAFWDGTRMTYGDGAPGSFIEIPLVSIDVVAHEITHGLTERTSNLIYADESGALNESFSDIFGATVNFHERPDEATWKIGGDLTIDGEGIRNMRDPNLFDNPGTYDGNFWVDGAGVHTNSGVQNHWFQLLTDGETGTNELGFPYDLVATALDTAAEIAYQNNAFYLTPSSNYQDAGFNSTLAAGNLYGTCSIYPERVYDAWQAVNVIFGYPGIVSATFNLSEPIFCDVNAEVVFNNTSFAESYFWEFGDGGTSTEESPTHVYGAEGSYTVTLTAYGGECNADTVTQVYEDAVLIDVDNLQCTAFFLDSDQTVEECSGILYDSGGPDEPYSNNENHTFTIINPSGATIEVELTFFETESGWDFVSFHDGPDAAAPLIDNISGTHTGSTYASTGGALTIVFESDGSITRPGFEITWGNGQGSGPADASFTADVLTPLINQPVTFTGTEADLIWNFADGSPVQNASGAITHSFQSAGTFTVMAVDDNCAEQDTVLLDIEVQEATSYTIDPAMICDTLLSNETADHVITVTNTGDNTGWLDAVLPNNAFYTISGVPADNLIDPSESIELTVTLDPNGLMPQAYQANMELLTSDATEAIVDFPVKLRVVGVPDVDYSTNFLNFGQVFTNQTTFQELTIFSTGTDSLYVNDIVFPNPLFGTATTTPFGIAAGDDQTLQIDFYGTPDPGLITGTFQVVTNAGNQNISYIIDVKDAPVASVGPDSICVTLDAGMSLDTFVSINNSGLSALEFAVSQAMPAVDWLELTDDQTILAAGAQLEYGITLDATNLNEGTYNTTIGFASNDPQLDTLTIPVKLIVIGTPGLAIDRDTLDFGGVQLTTSEILTLRVINPGSADLVINSVTIASGQYAADQFSFDVPPGGFQDINVIFAPSLIGELNTTLTLSGPTHNQVVPVLGTGLPVPQGNLSRDTICVELESGEMTSESMVLSNLGQGELEYTTGLGGLGNRTLVWTFLADENSLSNMMTVLEDGNSLLQVSTTDTDDATEMAALLETTDLLVIPSLGFLNFQVEQDMAAVMLPWLEAGGRVIAAGNGSNSVTSDMNLHAGNFHLNIFSADNVEVELPDHPLLDGVQLPLGIDGGMTAVSGVQGVADLTAIAVNPVAPNESMLFTQVVGEGETVFLGYEYFELSQQNERILRNAIEYTRTEIPFPDWLTVDNTNGTITPGGETNVNLDFDAGTLPGGVYTFPLSYSYNQPNNNLGLVFLKMVIVTAPVAAFSTPNEVTCDGIVNFFDQSAQEPTSWEWNFGDGSPVSNEQNPVHEYQISGTYTVTLTVCNDLGCNTITQEDFVSVELDNPFCVTTVFEDGESVELMGCGGIIMSTNAPDNYPNNVSSEILITSGNGGPLRLTFTSFELEGCCDWLRIYDGPDANADLIGEYNGFDLEEGDIILSTGGQLYMTFTTDGSVTRPGFEFMWQCADDISNVVASVEPEPGCPATYFFEAVGGLETYSYSWDFGDGTTAEGAGAHAHTYASTGTYIATLLVENDGETVEVERTVMVGALNLPLGIIGPDTVVVNTNATFEKDGTDLLETFEWTEESGATGTGPVFTTSWNAIGTYQLRLDASSSEVCSAATIKDVVVVMSLDARDAVEVAELKLFPNPVGQTLYFELETTLTNRLSYRVVDALGRTVLAVQNDVLAANGPVSIEVGQLPAATYALEILSEDGRHLATRRFVKR